MTEEEVPNTTFLKWVVIILGILILGVATTLGLLMYKRATAETEVVEEAPIAAPASAEVLASMPGKISRAPAQTFGNVDINAPDGMAAIGVHVSGDRLLVIYGVNATTPKMVVIVSQISGKIIGRFSL